MRADILELLWAANEDALYITKQQFLAGFVDWDITPHYVDDIMVAAVLNKGSEFHFARFGGKWTLTRADIRRYLGPILKQYGCVTTRTPKEDTRQGRCTKVQGFKVTGEDEFYTHFRLEQPLANGIRNAICP